MIGKYTLFVWAALFVISASAAQELPPDDVCGCGDLGNDTVELVGLSDVEREAFKTLRQALSKQTKPSQDMLERLKTMPQSTLATIRGRLCPTVDRGRSDLERPILSSRVKRCIVCGIMAASMCLAPLDGGAVAMATVCGIRDGVVVAKTASSLALKLCPQGWKDL